MALCSPSAPRRRRLQTRSDPLLLYYRVDCAALGVGSTCVVRRGVHVLSGKEVAIKTIRLVPCALPQQQQVERELRLLESLGGRGERVLRVLEAFSDARAGRVHLVTELMRGGDVLAAWPPPAPERTVREVARGTLEALSFLHGEGIMHRDVKPENLGLARPGDPSSLRLLDFGLARVAAVGAPDLSRACASKSGRLYTMCGTPEFVAPEVLCPPAGAWPDYSTPVDLWSTGVTLYVMLIGDHPFCGGSAQLLYEDIQSREPRAVRDRQPPRVLPPAATTHEHCARWDLLSPAVRDLVLYLLRKRPAERLAAPQALRHPWFARSREEPAGFKYE